MSSFPRPLPVLAGVVLAACLASPLFARSLAPNGDFEDGLEGWSLFVHESSKDAGPAFALATEGARSGRGFVRLSSSVRARFAAVLPPVAVAPGERYRVSAWVRVSPGLDYSVGPLVRIHFREASPSSVETSLCLDTTGRVVLGVSPSLPRPATLPEVWQQIEGVIEVPARAVTAGIALFAWGTRGTVDFDDFVMELVPASTPLSQVQAAGENDGGRSIAPLSVPRLNEVASYISARPTNVTPSWSDRAYWESAARLPAAVALLQSAAEMQGTLPPVVTEELFNDFAVSGLRRPYEVPNSTRTNRIFTLVLAECLAPDPARLAQIVREVEGVLDEPTWCLPAHTRNFPNWHASREHIDLAASARGWTMANTDWLLAERLPAATRKRIRKEVGERILRPWITRIRAGESGELWWMMAAMNWSAVCNAGVLGSALLLLDDPQERAEYLVGWEQLNPYFLSGFTSDGYCAEGVGYWNYGFGHFLIASQLVHHVTGGRVDPLDSDQVRQITAYASGVEIDQGHYAPFSDMRPGDQPNAHLLDFGAVRFGLGQVRSQPLFKGISALGGHIHLALFDLAIDRASVAGADHQPLPLRKWFPIGGALIARGSTPGQGLSVALKGGHNNEPHNQNDLGTFVVVADGRMALTEVGNDDYVKGTFGPLRYTSGVNNSFGHPVPRVAGKLQSAGAEARAVTVRTEFTPERDIWEIDLTTAYAVPELKKLTRTFVFTRADGGSLEVLDQAEFSSPQDFGVAFVLLPAQRWVEDGADGHLVEGGTGRGRVRVVISSGEDSRLIRSEEAIAGILAGAAPKGLRVGFDLARPAASVRIRTLITPAPATPSP